MQWDYHKGEKEHLWRGETGRWVWLVWRRESLEGISSIYKNIPRAGPKGIVPNFVQRCSVTGQEVMAMNQPSTISTSAWGTSFHGGWKSTGTAAQGGVGVSHSGNIPKPPGHAPVSPGDPALDRGGTEDLQSSLPTLCGFVDEVPSALDIYCWGMNKTFLLLTKCH